MGNLLLCLLGLTMVYIAFILLQGADAHTVAVDWFGGRYEICSQRAQLVKIWLPENAIHDQPTFMDQVVFERALSLVSILLAKRRSISNLAI